MARLRSSSQKRLAALDAVLPPTWSHGNPVDIIGDAGPERYRAAIMEVMRDGNTDAVLVMNVPTALASSTDAAKATVEAVKEGRKLRSGQTGAGKLAPAQQVARGEAAFQGSENTGLRHAGRGRSWHHSARPLWRRSGRTHANAASAPGRDAFQLRCGGSGHRACAQGRPEAHDRARSQGRARGLRHPNRADPRRRDTGGGQQGRGGVAGQPFVPGGENPLAGHHPQVGHRRRAARPQVRGGCREGDAANARRYPSAKARRQAPGRHGPANDKAPRCLRTYSGHNFRSHLRTCHPVRRGWHGGRSHRRYRHGAHSARPQARHGPDRSRPAFTGCSKVSAASPPSIWRASPSAS